jgi:ABC-2 type transport system ATP-binding protein
MIKKDVPAIVVKNLTKTFNKRSPTKWFWQHRYEKVTAVNKVSFTVDQGEIFGLIGPNGSGKSTVIRMLSTLLYPTSGTVKIFGLDVLKDAFAVKDLINRVSVEAAFYKLLSARENLVYSSILYGENPKLSEIRGATLLENLGLKIDYYDMPLENMSRGMQQKVAIVRALLSSPKLVLLDEPTTGLDPKSRQTVQDAILELKHKHGATILITSHDMTEIERVCDRVAFLNKGTIVKQGTISELKASINENVCLTSLEDVFIKLTGQEVIEEADYEEDD